jgi:hypothetical protein
MIIRKFSNEGLTLTDILTSYIENELENNQYKLLNYTSNNNVINIEAPLHLMKEVAHS